MDKTLATAIATVKADLAESGGGTYEYGTLLPFRPKDGYAIGIGGAAVKADISDESLALLLRGVAGEYITAYVGTWIDPWSGVLYIDAVEYTRDIERAYELARANGQLAFYGFAEAQSFEVQG